MIRPALILAAAVIAASWSDAARAESHVALVIGNTAYATATEAHRVKSAANDARDMADALSGMGFHVTLETDLGRRDMMRALYGFARRAAEAETALFFFAGRDIEVEGAVHIVPVDARIARDADAAFDAVPLETVLRAMNGARLMKLVLLDTSRGDPHVGPVPGASKKPIGRDRDALTHPRTAVLFATRAGRKAVASETRNSHLTAALLSHVATPGLDIAVLLRRVRDDVLSATDAAQEPVFFGAMPARPVFLVPQATPRD